MYWHSFSRYSIITLEDFRRFDHYFVGRLNLQETLQSSSGSRAELAGNGLSDGKLHNFSG
jgi:hypothetical protein